MQKKLQEQGGFTLVESMVVVAIIAILIFVGNPMYQDHMRNTKRADAQTVLVSFAAAMERHFTANNSYLGAASSGNTGAPGIFASESPLNSDTKVYDLTIHAATATTYTLRATPKSGHAMQKTDGFLQLSSTGQKAWDKNNDGSIGTGEYTWEK